LFTSDHASPRDQLLCQWSQLGDNRGSHFSDPSPEELIVALVETKTLRKAERLVESCEHCNPTGAEILFDNNLDRITGSDPSVIHPRTTREMPELPA
jgi:hypothetical protein